MSRVAMSSMGNWRELARSLATLPALWPWRTTQSTLGVGEECLKIDTGSMAAIGQQARLYAGRVPAKVGRHPLCMDGAPASLGIFPAALVFHEGY